MTKKAAKAQAQAQAEGAAEPAKKSNHVQRILEQRKKDAKIDPLLEGQFSAGRLYAAISSRPGQSGRSDGYILEGKELEVSVTALWRTQSKCLFWPSSTSGKLKQGNRSMLTVHEDINTSFDTFRRERIPWPVCCTSSKGMRAYDSAPPLAHLSIRAGVTKPVLGVRLIVATGSETR